MRLDHVSYVTSHDQLSDTVQRLGSLIGGSFVDGGIHPRFGTRNFTLALKESQYIEVVCPLDHPATELTPWGRAVSKKSQEGGGWFTWVFSTDDLDSVSMKFGRESTQGHRTRPDGTDLKWKQIGVKEITETRQLPFFIQWLTSDHPSQDGKQTSSIKKIKIADQNELADSWFKEEILQSLGEVEIEWMHPEEIDSQQGIIEIHLSTPRGIVVID